MSISTRTSPPLPPAAAYDLEVTILSGKHLKNVNWKNGNLKPYAIFWVDPDHKLTTKSDDSGHTKPIWNQRFTFPINLPLSDSSFSLEIFHSKASEAPKPFVGSLQVSLSDLPDPSNASLLRAYDLHRPSGRPQGKIRLKLALKEHPLPPPPSVPDYQNTPLNPYYYSSAPPYPYSSAPRSGPTTPYPNPNPYSMGYYSGYYPPPLNRYGAPSAPVEYAHSRVGGGFGLGSGLAVGAVAGGLGGLALDEGTGLKREEGRIGERVEDNLGGRDDFSDYRPDY